MAASKVLGEDAVRRSEGAQDQTVQADGEGGRNGT